MGKGVFHVFSLGPPLPLPVFLLDISSFTASFLAFTARHDIERSQFSWWRMARRHRHTYLPGSLRSIQLSFILSYHCESCHLPT